jgi:hypothetical protein
MTPKSKPLTAHPSLAKSHIPSWYLDYGRPYSTNPVRVIRTLLAVPPKPEDPPLIPPTPSIKCTHICETSLLRKENKNRRPRGI